MKKLSPQDMIEGYWFNCLLQGFEPPLEKGWLEDALIRLIEESLVAYDAETDMVGRCGPLDEQGRPDPGEIIRRAG